MTWTVPARIETERLVIRKYELSDVAEMSRVIPADREHLAPYLPWARAEPVSDDERRATVALFIAQHESGEDFPMGIFERATGEYVGGAGFHTRRGAGVLEIGYWIASSHEGRGLVTETVLAQTAVALLYAGARRVEIYHAPDNARSGAVPRRAGFAHEGLAEADEHGPAMERWVADVSTLTREPAASTPLPTLRDASGAALGWPLWHVPARIETERLVIRRFRHEDVPEVSRVITANRDHLVRYLAWAEDEPKTPEARAATIAQNIAHHEAGVDFLMGLFDRVSGEYLGSAGLHPLDDRPGLEVGYWLSAEHEGRGLMSEAVAALTRVGLMHAGADTVEIFHRPDNARSGAVPRRLGFTDAGLTRDTDDGAEAHRWVADRGTLTVEPLAIAPFPRLADADGTAVAWQIWDVPSRIDTERLVLRRYEPEDVDAVHEAVLTNLDHLRPFIPWAKDEPLTLAQRVEQLAEHSRAFDAGEQFRFAVLDRVTGAFIGGAGLHTRVGPEALEVGYWIAADRAGHGLVTEAVRALTRVAFEAGARRAEIWCDADNVRSHAVAQRCGYTALGERVRGGERLLAWALEAPGHP
ncbi:GNAT family N-acetyltransferase [Demequina iriomotensis]|uniref:GNAT family N-acetyltransferase n=1 Tax=Demequina iriomotensis TaxID=1536641 RepID=UPI000A5ACFF3|nr:GNAT family N-acetyltransferase [Demequina iriomotensis]